MTRFSFMRRDERGAVTLELGLLAPIIGMLLMGMVEMSQAMSARTELEQAVQRGIEMVQQGTGSTSSLAAIRADVAGVAEIDSDQVTVEALSDCIGGADKEKPIAFACPTGTTQARYIRVKAWKAYAPTFGLHFGDNELPNGDYRMSAQSSIRIQ